MLFLIYNFLLFTTFCCDDILHYVVQQNVVKGGRKMLLNNQQILALRKKRGELNLTIKDLSKLVGVSRWTLSDILKGKKNEANVKTIKKIDEWLNTTK